MNRLSASAIVIALAASIASCSLTRPTPVKQMFLIEAPAPAAAVTPQSPLAARIGTVTVAAPYRDRAFVVREAELRFETDFYHEYVVAPAPMIAEAVANALAQSGAFAKVIPPGAPPEAELTIDAFVGSLHADNRDAKAPTAELAITFYVPRRRLWVKVTESRTYMAGIAEKTTRLGRELRLMGAELGSRDALEDGDLTREV